MMNENLESEQERLDETSWPRNWEDQCFAELEQEALEDKVRSEQELSSEKLWLYFQNSAAAVAELYRERLLQNTDWVPFQNAASSVTTLYKESVEMQKSAFDLGLQLGSHRKVKDLVAWAKKKRRHIRREDLLAFMCGKTLPPRQRPSPPRVRAAPRTGHGRVSPEFSRAERLPSPEPDLTTFQNALAVQGLSGAMSNISMGYRSSPDKTDDLNCFIMDELTRHNEMRKRTLNEESHIDAQTRTKRARLF